jgi:hypothetical protein
LVELWELASAGGAVLAVALKEIDRADFLFRVEASTADEEKTNEEDGYDGYYPANDAANNGTRVGFTPGDKKRH